MKLYIKHFLISYVYAIFAYFHIQCLFVDSQASSVQVIDSKEPVKRKVPVGLVMSTKFHTLFRIHTLRRYVH